MTMTENYIKAYVLTQGNVGRYTPVIPAVNHLKRFNVKMGFEIPKLINFFSSFAGKLYLVSNLKRIITDLYRLPDSEHIRGWVLDPGRAEHHRQPERGGLGHVGHARLPGLLSDIPQPSAIWPEH